MKNITELVHNASGVPTHDLDLAIYLIPTRRAALSLLYYEILLSPLASPIV
jgi:hypothetical protein